MSRRVRTALVAIAVLGTVASSCGNDDAAGTAPEPTIADDTADDLEEAAETSDDLDAHSVSRADLAAVLQGGFFEQQSALDEILVACMAERGFVWFADGVEAPGSALSDVLFVDTYGYGITTFIEDGSDEIDPNLQYFEQLDPDAQAAYNTALVGNPNGEAPVSDDSCLALERETLDLASAAITSEIVVQAISEYSSRLASDPEVVTANAAWVSCLAEAGYAYQSRDDIIAELAERADAASTPDRLYAAQEYELAVARADFDCADGLREATRSAADRLVVELLDKYTPE